MADAAGAGGVTDYGFVQQYHPDYHEARADWELMRDALSSRKVKEGREKYLPRPSGFDRLGKAGIHRDMSKEGEIDQRVNSLPELFAKARSAEPDFNKEVNSSATLYGAEAMFGTESSPGSNLKSYESAMRKLGEPDIGTASHLGDIMRATLAFDSVPGSRSAASDFIAHHDVVRVKDRWVKTGTGAASKHRQIQRCGPFARW
jgi:hypothetical protein